jgi:DEAD/DEAH box helicase domain-containing protein
VHEANLKVTERITGYEKRRTSGQELIGVVDLNLPPLHFETVGIWIEIPDKVKKTIRDLDFDFMGGIHAMEHAAISMFPLFALCDRDDIGGISTPEHPQVCRAAVFIYDGHSGGVGLSHRAFDIIEELLQKTRLLVEKCPCETGCPSCIHSPKCGSGNKPLDKTACLLTLEFLLNPASLEKPVANLSLLKGAGKKPKTIRRPASSRSDVPAKEHKAPRRKPVIFPDLEQAEPKTEKPRMNLSSRSDVVIFDLETQKLAEDVGGWRNVRKMGLSIAVVHTEQNGFLTFTEANVADLIAVLKGAGLVVGFNHIRFDYEVLKAYTSEDLRMLPNLDILVDVEAALGHRLSLDHLATFTLGEQKSGKGTDAVKWFREGRMDLLEKYCRDDVRITRDLYRFGLDNGFLRYQRKNGQIASLQVSWRSGNVAQSLV